MLLFDSSLNRRPWFLQLNDEIQIRTWRAQNRLITKNRNLERAWRRKKERNLLWRQRFLWRTIKLSSNYLWNKSLRIRQRQKPLPRIVNSHEFPWKYLTFDSIAQMETKAFHSSSNIFSIWCEIEGMRPRGMWYERCRLKTWMLQMIVMCLVLGVTDDQVKRMDNKLSYFTEMNFNLFHHHFSTGHRIRRKNAQTLRIWTKQKIYCGWTVAA